MIERNQTTKQLLSSNYKNTKVIPFERKLKLSSKIHSVPVKDLKVHPIINELFSSSSDDVESSLDDNMDLSNGLANSGIDLKHSISKNEIINPVLVLKETDEIIVGVKRWKSAIELEQELIPVRYIHSSDNLSIYKLLAIDKIIKSKSWSLSKTIQLYLKVVPELNHWVQNTKKGRPLSGEVNPARQISDELDIPYETVRKQISRYKEQYFKPDKTNSNLETAIKIEKLPAADQIHSTISNVNKEKSKTKPADITISTEVVEQKATEFKNIGINQIKDQITHLINFVPFIDGAAVNYLIEIALPELSKKLKERKENDFSKK